MPHAILKKTFQRHFIRSAVSSVPVDFAGSIVHVVLMGDYRRGFKLSSSVHAALTSLK